MSVRRKTRRMLPRALAGLGLLQVAIAHEKWFIEEDRFQTQLATAFDWPQAGFVLLALAVLAGAELVWRSRSGRPFLPGPEVLGADERGLRILYGLAPVILGVHLAVPLLISGVSGNLFAPNALLEGAWPYVLGLVQTGIALSLFYGGFARLAAVALLLLWLLGFVAVGPESMLENLHIPGFAVFFFLVGRGPYSIDRLVFPRLEPSSRLATQAVPILRIAAGLSFIVVAFTEKLANLPLALAFLDTYPLNFSTALGIPIPDDLFVLAAGAVELTIGLLLVRGIFVRETIIIAWLPFNLTLTVFNWVELVGHLPFYGIMALLLVWDRRDGRLWEAGLKLGARPTSAS